MRHQQAMMRKLTDDLMEIIIISGRMPRIKRVGNFR